MTVAFVDTVHSVLWDRLTSNGFECIDLSSYSVDEIKVLTKNAEGLVVRSRFPIDREYLKSCSDLKFIARSGAGMENIDEDYCSERNIVLFNAPEGNRNAVAEHAIGMLLALFNKLHSADLEIRKGIWKREENRGHELEGKTIGIIGFGNNGSQFAKRLQGFDVKVLAYDKYKKNYAKYGAIESSMEDIFDNVDILSLHIPQTSETMGMVDDEFLSKFNKPIYLVNLSRGKIVKTTALNKALDSGKVQGACLDVLEFEKSSFEDMFDNMEAMPIDFKKLLASDKVLFSPHVGGWTHESYFKLSNVLADKILAHFGPC